MKTRFYAAALIVSLGGLVSPSASAAADLSSRPELTGILDLPFPSHAQNHGIYSGKVRVILDIDESGRVADSLIVGYTERSFVDGLAQALPALKFAPARDQQGAAVRVRTPLTINFHATGIVVNQTADENTQERPLDSEAGPFESRLCASRDLDRDLKPLRTVAPSASAAVAAEASVTVDFYVDESGRVRMPAVQSEANPALANAAMAAIAQWEFEPPTRAGQPVVVHATQAFVFHPAGHPAS